MNSRMAVAAATSRHDEAAIWGLRERSYGTFDLAGITQIDGAQLHTER